MNATEFVNAIRSEVQDSAVDEVMSLLGRPPGRRPAPALASLSQWFNGLSDADRQHVREVVALACHQAVFGFLAVLDGARVIEDPAERGALELRHVKAGQTTLLNSPGGPTLHDLLQQQ